MPIKLRDLLAKTATKAIEYGDETVLVSIRTNLEGAVAYAIADQAQQGDQMTPQQQREFFAHTIATYVAEWDILDDDDNVLPVTVENVARLPQGLAYLIFDAIKEQASPNPPSAATSAPGSEPTAKSDESLDGMSSSSELSILELPPGTS